MANENSGRPSGPDRQLTEEALRQAGARFRAFVNASTDIIYRMSPDWTEMWELDGRGSIVDTAEPRRNWIDEYIEAGDRPQVLAAIENAIRHRSTFELEHRVRRKDGSLGWTLSRAVPLLDDAGDVIEWFGTAIDVTDNRQTERQLAEVTENSDRQRRFYESMISSTPDLVYAFDREYRFTFANQALLEMWGRTLDDSLGKRLLEVGYEPWHAEMHEREIDQVIATKTGIRGEVGFTHAALGLRVYDYIFTPVLNADGEVESIAGTTRDITDIKRAEQHLQLLVHELNHRVKNTLATIQSIARQTFRGDAAEPAARTAFEERLIALSNAHTVLTRTNWECANLSEIAEQALVPFMDSSADSSSFVLEGEDIALLPQTALALAMAFHELASNAVKYGALSRREGRVYLTWQQVSGALTIIWRENGGPSVTTPSHKGFGSRLLERGLANQLNGVVRLDFSPAGVVCTIQFPMEGDPRVEHAQPSRPAHPDRRGRVDDRNAARGYD